jgi:branched-chain amino acid transport system ATP-binding protein
VTVGAAPSVKPPVSGRRPHELVVAHVSVRFGGVVALDDVTMTARQGEIVGIIGPNGAGKTTLFNVICGFVEPDSGTLHYRERSLARRRPHDLTRLGIARTIQAVGLWRGLSVLENVMTGAVARSRAGIGSALLGVGRSPREEARLKTRALALLADLGIADTAALSPAALPYGIQKRVALARSLIVQPTLLLLDEPASGLSAREMEELAALVRGLREEMGVLLVEHHMDLVMSVCDRLVVLHGGQVIAEGLPDEVRQNPAVTDAYLGDEIVMPAGGDDARR